MWCIFICHPHLTGIICIICCTAVWAQACGLERKTSFVIIVHLWFIRRPRSFSVVCWWELYHYTATSGTDHLELRNRDNVFQCVLVITLQYHEAVDFVQDSETEDPQLVAEPGVGRNHGKTVGKS